MLSSCVTIEIITPGAKSPKEGLLAEAAQIIPLSIPPSIGPSIFPRVPTVAKADTLPGLLSAVLAAITNVCQVHSERLRER